MRSNKIDFNRGKCEVPQLRTAHTHACTHARTHKHTHTHTPVLAVLVSWMREGCVQKPGLEGSIHGWGWECRGQGVNPGDMLSQKLARPVDRVT